MSTVGPLRITRTMLDTVQWGRSPLDALPGPAARTVARQFRRAPEAFLCAVRAGWGDVARLRLGVDLARVDMVLCSSPDTAQTVLAADAASYVKSPSYEVLRMFLGTGLLTSEGEEWRRHRRIVAPVFHRRHLEALDTAITDAGDEAIRRLLAADSRPVDVSAEMSRLTLTAVGAALFGADLSASAHDIAESLALAQSFTRDVFDHVFTWPLRRRAGRFNWPAARQASDRLDAVVADLLSAPGQDATTLLSLLRGATDERGDHLTRTELRDELVTFVLAGHETTSNALAWTLALLGTHGQVRRRLEDEVDAVLGDRPPTSDDVPKLAFTDAVIHESMRLYPPVWLVERAGVSDTEVAGQRVPAGVPVLVSPWVIHRHPDHWDAPESFDPDRWLDGRTDDLHSYAYIPFGGGPRRCVGEHFARLEATLLLAQLVRHLRIDPLPGRRLEPDPSVTVRVAGGLHATVTAR